MAPTNDTGSPRFDRVSAAVLDAAARVFSEEGTGANLASVAAAAGVSRATLYRYYASREVLLDALTEDALAEIAGRLAGAALQRASVEGAIERILRAFVAVGDRYAFLLGDHARVKSALLQVASPVQEVLARGVEIGVLRDDLSVEMLDEFLAGAALSAVKLTRQRQHGVEEASAAAASLFLDGSRRATPAAH